MSTQTTALTKFQACYGLVDLAMALILMVIRDLWTDESQVAWVVDNLGLDYKDKNVCAGSKNRVPSFLQQSKAEQPSSDNIGNLKRLSVPSKFYLRQNQKKKKFFHSAT